jgi:hypothetical protein
MLGEARRSPVALAYIAEIVRTFDLVGVIELRHNLVDIERVLDHLGPTWHALYSECEPDPDGNEERIGLLFDRSRIEELDRSPDARVPLAIEADPLRPLLSWWRPPFIVPFRAGKREFSLVHAQIRWGRSLVRRVCELGSLAGWIETVAHLEKRDVLVMGDFNISSLLSPAYQLLAAHGLLHMPHGIARPHGTDLAPGKRYDQIVHFGDSGLDLGRGGAVDFFEGSFAPLFPGVRSDLATYQLSDHFPLWVEVLL